MQQRQKATQTHQAQRKAQHHPTLARGAKSTTYSVRPVHLIFGALACVAATLGVSGSVGYYLVRSDMMAEASAEKTELVLEYQDHIDRLRAEIHKLTSRQMVDRETVEIQVMDVLRRQQSLNQRHAIVADLVARAENAGIYLSSDKPLPRQKPALDARSLASIGTDDKSAIGGESELIAEPVKALGLRESTSRTVDPLAILQQPAATAEPEPVEVKKNSEKQATLDAVKADITEMDVESTAAVDAITVATESRIEDILSITRQITPSINTALRKDTAIGGPFMPISENTFPDRIKRADAALKALRKVKFTTLRLPVKRPVKNGSVSSNYGPRVDPFLKRLAMHTGIDFKAPYGSRVYSTAPGTVLAAKWKGGYGKMVEIRHANGFVTRYAHLSRMHVKAGDHVLAGDLIGNIGSTGRSTGPHLHYEVRRHDKPHNPAKFLSAGEKLSKLSL
ncbi:M23 family metallopeptidase [Roseibium sp. MMSF_3544]|uniref:M23 family metallopeptidase n=1 Tax=unclassified Roseibium TaxID=2629323 RepID=UPI00273E051C|nr:M23 family metallopeptidase [Roseibium sp. MMSF_3544]